MLMRLNLGLHIHIHTLELSKSGGVRSSGHRRRTIQQDRKRGSMAMDLTQYLSSSKLLVVQHKSIDRKVSAAFSRIGCPSNMFIRIVIQTGVAHIFQHGPFSARRSGSFGIISKRWIIHRQEPRIKDRESLEGVPTVIWQRTFHWQKGLKFLGFFGKGAT
jgi:hypothetical protein